MTCYNNTRSIRPFKSADCLSSGQQIPIRVVSMHRAEPEPCSRTLERSTRRNSVPEVTIAARKIRRRPRNGSERALRHSTKPPPLFPGGLPQPADRLAADPVLTGRARDLKPPCLPQFRCARFGKARLHSLGDPQLRGSPSLQASAPGARRNGVRSFFFAFLPCRLFRRGQAVRFPRTMGSICGPPNRDKTARGKRPETKKAPRFPAGP